MGLFPSANDFKAGKGVEKDAPRKTGVGRFFELVGRDMNGMFLANLLACIGFLPVICLVYIGFLANSLPVMLAQLAAGAFFYFVICTTLSRKMSYKGVYNIGPRQLTSAFFIGILFMFQAALLSGGQVVVLDRSLIMTMFVGQFYFLTLLYFQTEVFKLSAMQKEMDTLNLLYERQREQYQVARQNVQIINKRCR